MVRSGADEEQRLVWRFFALACAITWMLDAPWAIACVRGVRPPAFAEPLVALGALGPTAAALLLAAPRGELRGSFGRWRTNPLLVCAGLLVYPLLLRVPANLLNVALGAAPAPWFEVPREPIKVALPLLFALGGEFGWRGFAYPRVVRCFGLVRGNLLLGAVWGLWHVGLMFLQPHGGFPAPSRVLQMIVHLALASVVMAWLLERGRRSMAIAIAVHAGILLERLFAHDERLRALHTVVLALWAGLVTWGAHRRSEG